MTIKKTRRSISRIAAAAAAAVMALTAIPAIPASAAIDLKNLPVPIAENKSSSAAKNFSKTVPKLYSVKHESDYWDNYAVLSWKPVSGALYYKVYRKEEGGVSKCIANVLDTEYYDECDIYTNREYKIKAVTFTYSDEKILTKFSNVVEAKAVKKSKPSYYDYGYDEVSADAGASYDEEDSFDDDDDYDYESAPAPVATAADAAYAPSLDVPANTEEYSKSEESGYKKASLSPLSTFSADVDTASYANLRRLINDGSRIPTDAVRIEEMLNYFDYDYQKPAGNSRFSVSTELSDCPWNDKAQLLAVGIQGMDLDKTPDSNLVFLIDTSGSMYSSDKLELACKSIRMLSKTLTENDRVSIVTYSGEERVVIAGAKGNQVNTVNALTTILEADGVTNGESGIQAAYAIAEKYFIEGGNNRIILCTDGDLNVGITDENELKKLVEEKRRSGVYLSVMGFGTGNIKDNKMETLADNGNGSYHYIDSVNEAKKIFNEERNSTLYTIAKDVKIQVEFNPKNVEGYRLIGYDNRRLANEDFTNDAKDAGEVGAGGSVTALYEIIPAVGKTASGLKYQQTTPQAAVSDELLTVKVRYKNPDNGKTYQTAKTVVKSDYAKEMSSRLKLACAVTEFGLVLKNSDYKGTASISGALKLAKSVEKPDVYEKELAELIEKYSKDHKVSK
ncbi:MAG: von Willebrand factor type A domain-containing protein [Oscillospiraceae bacterium]|nr:von Willebrand factor type A domain-containing protein [Oscillospiraceae bacterium]